MLDEKISFEEQMKYFNYSKYIKSDRQSFEPDKSYIIARLFTPNLDVEDKRYYLSSLAAMPDVAAYRAIETYHSSPLEPELANWSALALIESKILLNTDLSGEKQFYLSTGLGGKDGKLRFFAVLASANRDAFTDFQCEMILRELQFSFEQNKIEVEEIVTKANYVRMLVLCDLDHNVKTSIESAITECNELGAFIDEKFIVTNVKQVEDAEIESLLLKKSESAESEAQSAAE